MAFICRLEDSSFEIKSKFSNLDYSSKVDCLYKLENSNLPIKYQLAFLNAKSTTFDFVSKLNYFCTLNCVSDSEMQSILTDLNYRE